VRAQAVLKIQPGIPQFICPSQIKMDIVAVPKPARRPIENGEASEPALAPAFTERPAWRAVGDGWPASACSVRGAGVTLSARFQGAREFDWGKSFHPAASVCLNLEGEGPSAQQMNRIRAD